MGDFAKERLLYYIQKRYDYYSARAILGEALSKASVGDKGSYSQAEIDTICGALRGAGPNQGDMIKQIRIWAGLQEPDPEPEEAEAAPEAEAEDKAPEAAADDAEAKKKAEEQAKKKAEEEAKKKAEEEAKKKAEEEAKKKAEKKAEEEAKKKAEEEAKKKAEEEAKKKAEEEAKKKAEEEAKKKAEEEAKKKAEEEAKKKAEEEAKKKADDDKKKADDDKKKGDDKKAPTETKISIAVSGVGDGGDVYLTGDGKDLGDWDPKKGLKLASGKKKGTLSGELVAKPGDKVSCKLAVVPGKGEPIWEGGENRSIEVPAEAEWTLELAWQPADEDDTKKK